MECWDANPESRVFAGSWLGGGDGLGSLGKVVKWGCTEVDVGVQELKAFKGVLTDGDGGPVSGY